MKSNDKKQSSIDHDKKIEHMAKAVSKTNRMVYAVEEKKMVACIFLQRLGGRVVLSLLQAKKEAHVDALQKEICARNIEHSEPLGDMNWNARRALLKTHELDEMAKQPGGVVVGGKRWCYKTSLILCLDWPS